MSLNKHSSRGWESPTSPSPPTPPSPLPISYGPGNRRYSFSASSTPSPLFSTAPSTDMFADDLPLLHETFDSRNVPSVFSLERQDRSSRIGIPAGYMLQGHSLERCQLKDVVAAKPEKLEALVVDGGDNWSVGQRQLLCLGRIMLKRSKILFMDEATTSVDSQTDAVIQKIIREDFADRTIISIAHRILTVMDCDKALVIDTSFAKEYDKPSRLLERHSLFAALVKEYSNRST